MINSLPAKLRRALVWLLGGATMSGWQPVLAMLPYVVLGLGVLLTMGHALNVMQVGEEQAQQLGLPVERVRLLVVVAASLATAAAVSFCRDHRLCRFDRPSRGAHDLGGGLPAHSAPLRDQRGNLAPGG